MPKRKPQDTDSDVDNTSLDTNEGLPTKTQSKKRAVTDTNDGLPSKSASKRTRKAPVNPKPTRHFSEEETSTLLRLVDEHNKDWKRITEEFNKIFGRTKDLLYAKYAHEMKKMKKTAGGGE
ncbi:hypothetical protein HK097_003608 [Rhizophlyctis rosea]|uniref:Myb-like domain-containing protein n=1 Tax=Rhizophlyctis rosea TaxID=64517 RepID=A0AAD5S2N8_9FUNG|nr:hypothetical protein HK097_003608 [Rhizophlyctis rosea]